MGYGYETKIGCNTQGCLHRHEAARVIGHGGCCHPERHDCNDWHDTFSHGLLLVKVTTPLRLRTGATSLKTIEAPCVPGVARSCPKFCRCGDLLTASWR